MVVAKAKAAKTDQRAQRQGLLQLNAAGHLPVVNKFVHHAIIGERLENVPSTMLVPVIIGTALYVYSGKEGLQIR